MITDFQWSYLAGFFDGEGSITIHENCRPSPRGLSPNHTLQITMGNTHPAIPKLLYSELGGSLILSDRSAKANHRNFAQWSVRAAKTLPFLYGIRPYVIMKKEQVELGIKFQESKKDSSLRVSQETINWRENIRQQIRELNWLSRIDAEDIAKDKERRISIKTGKREKRKTHCVNGHSLLVESNYRIDKNGWKQCRLCEKEKQRKYYYSAEGAARREARKESAKEYMRKYYSLNKDKWKTDNRGKR